MQPPLKQGAEAENSLRPFVDGLYGASSGGELDEHGGRAGGWFVGNVDAEIDHATGMERQYSGCACLIV